MLRTGQLLRPASHPASRPRTGASLPGTLASPRTGLSPAGSPQLVAWLRHDNLLVVMAPKLLDALPDRRVGDQLSRILFSRSVCSGFVVTRIRSHSPAVRTSAERSSPPSWK